jgi:hypothetical protein
MFDLPTTIDKIAKEMQDEYLRLYLKKDNGELIAKDLERFQILSKKLSIFRIDPGLQLREDDLITKMVKDELGQQFIEIEHNPKTPEELIKLKKKVKEVLDRVLQKK